MKGKERNEKTISITPIANFSDKLSGKLVKQITQSGYDAECIENKIKMHPPLCSQQLLFTFLLDKVNFIVLKVSTGCHMQLCVLSLRAFVEKCSCLVVLH
jgi:hypothetical protein